MPTEPYSQTGPGLADSGNLLDRCNVVWDSPSRDSSGSMPLGNGDIGVNAWVEEGGDLLFYVSKTDAWSEHAHLLKLGRIRVAFRPNPFTKGPPFRQELRLGGGEIQIVAGAGKGAVTLRLWVDANAPVIRLEADSADAFEMQVTLEVWRCEPQQLQGREEGYVERFSEHEPPVISPDVVVPDEAGRICWYHRNEQSVWQANLQLQGLGELIGQLSDPLLGRIFGGLITGRGLVSADHRTLKSAGAASHHRFTVCVLTDQTAGAEEWRRRLGRLAAGICAGDWQKAREAHQAWWVRFWDRSWVYVSGPPEAQVVTRGYALQRFINACAGRGGSPIKFNGSIFTVEGEHDGVRYGPDFRTWGGPYWFQNTRLPYGSMPAAGDFDLMAPLFDMYQRAASLASGRTRLYYGHEGVFFPETMHFWGTYFNFNYGYQREGKPAGLTDNTFIRYYWQDGLELAAMMLDYYECTQDRRFFAQTLLPLAEGVVTFFDQHWRRDAGGKIHFAPAGSLETWHEAINPLPEIAGLRCVLSGLLSLPCDLTTSAQRRAWQRTLADLPDLPVGAEGDKTFLLPAEKFDKLSNCENPQLYAVFPYRLFGVGKGGLGTALETWARRRNPQTGGWQQNAIQAACLGLAGQAAEYVAANFSTWHAGSRFPAFWGPNYDWIPDQDHGCVAMIALQRMLLQTDGGRILLFPAWPREWDVRFKLHAPFQTTVEGVYRGGRLEQLNVTPAGRERDVVNCLPGSA